MKILVTGFDAFGKDSINPASLILDELPSEILGAKIITSVIPTIAYQSLEVIGKQIQSHHPDMILSIGQAGGRSEITLERIGINLNDFRIPDNAGQQLKNTPVFADGPDAYFTNLPILSIEAHLQEMKIPCSISNSAGTFVCNHVLYGVRYYCEHHALNIRSGFVHVPYLPEQTLTNHQPSMCLSLQRKAIIEIIKTMIEEGK